MQYLCCILDTNIQFGLHKRHGSGTTLSLAVLVSAGFLQRGIVSNQPEIAPASVWRTILELSTPKDIRNQQCDPIYETTSWVLVALQA